MAALPDAIAERALWARDFVFLALVALALFLQGFASLPAQDRDESRYLTASDRMAETGDIVDLRFQDEPRYQQPAGIYWLQALATTALDGPEHGSVWTYRVPSLLAGIAAVLMTAWLGASLFGRKAGFVAAALMASCLILNMEARTAKTDAVLLAAILAAQCLLARAYLGARLSWPAALGFWAAIGAGLLIKGPVILMVVGSTALALVAWDREWRWLGRLRPLWGVPLALAIALPWFIAIGIVSDGLFYARSLGKNFLSKVGAGGEGHGGPPGYHLAFFTAMFWPGSLLAMAALPFVWRERVQRPVRFLIAWIVPTWVIFEIVATKLPHYVLPTYPAIACLAAAALLAPVGVSGRASRIVFGVAAVLWFVVSAALAAAAPGALWYLEGIVDPIAILIGLAAFAAAAAALWLFLKQRQTGSVAAMVLAASCVWANAFGYAAPRLDHMWLTPRIVAAAQAAGCTGAILATNPYHEGSLVFSYGRTQVVLAPSAAAAADAVAQDPCGLALIGAAQLDEFMARARTLSLNVRETARIDGLNYSNGRKMDLRLFEVRRGGP